MNTAKWIRALAFAGVMIVALVTGRSARSVSSLTVNPTNTLNSKKVLLEKLERACLYAAKKRQHADPESECGCLKSYHEDDVSERYIPFIINTYTGRSAYDTAVIPDELSIALENDSTALANCAHDPNWFRNEEPAKIRKKAAR